MTMLKEIYRLDERKWSGEVTVKWQPAPRFFTKSAAEIARGLKSASDDYAQAARRLNFYINRGGKNLSSEDMSRLEAAKVALKKAYGIKESVTISEQTFNMDYNPVNSSTVSAIHAVAKAHLAGVKDKKVIDTLLTLAYARGFSAGHSELENQSKRHLMSVSSKESVKSAIDAAFAKGFSAGRSSWQ
jgi:hypothetical protein